MTLIERLIQAANARALAAERSAQASINALAAAAFATLWRALTDQPDLSPREAIAKAQLEFGGGFAEAIAAAFSDLLQRSVGVAEVRAMPVGDLTLSRRLYLHNVQTAAEVVALRAVQTQDFMTAHWAELPHSLLGKVSNRIINEVRGINRVVYDVTSKPPGTIEWE